MAPGNFCYGSQEITAYLHLALCELGKSAKEMLAMIQQMIGKTALGCMQGL